MLWRFLETPPASGDWNMAIDAAIARGGFCETPTLRIFGWQPYCISLGYHQNVEDVDLSACEEAGIDVARRPTGGGAIFHAQEVTYSASVPASHAWYDLMPLDLYRKISEAIADGLRRLGAAVTFAPGGPQRLRAADGRPLRMACFASSARNELLCNGKKIAGSAQRRFREGALQHGSILLGAFHRGLIDFLSADDAALNKERASLIDHTMTLAEACRRNLDAPEVVAALREGFEAKCDIRFEESQLLPEEEELGAVWRERHRILIHNKETSLCSDVRSC
jgi:lipoate-protein ligase A